VTILEKLGRSKKNDEFENKKTDLAIHQNTTFGPLHLLQIQSEDRKRWWEFLEIETSE